MEKISAFLNISLLAVFNSHTHIINFINNLSELWERKCFEVFILPYNISDWLALSDVATLLDPLLFYI